MQFREHKGSLSDSMETTCFVRDHEHLAAIIRDRLYQFCFSLDDHAVTVRPYAADSRIGWDTHVVKLDGYGVIGFTDGPVPQRTDPTPGVRFRVHRRSLSDSLSTTRGIERRGELVGFLHRQLTPWGRFVTDADVTIQHEKPAEEMSGWDTHIVLIKDYGVAGFLSGPLV